VAIAVLLATTALAAPVSSGQPAGAGSIRGRVEFRTAAALPTQRPNPINPATGVRRLEVEAPQAVLYLASAPRGAFEQSDTSRVRLDQRNETFVPHVLAITTGTVVDFPNSDSIYHNVFSLSKAARFDLGRYAAGRSRSIRFDRPGIVRVFCDIHSHMNAFILVFSHPFFSPIDDEGRYRIDGIPPGSYSVEAWSDKGSFETKTAVVSERAVTQLDFVSQ
jgi:plastocyanin